MPILPARSDVAAAGALCAECKGADLNAGLKLDCAGYAVFSAAMAQLLVCLSKTLESVGQRLILTSVPEAMQQDMAHLGLTGQLRRWEDHA